MGTNRDMLFKVEDLNQVEKLTDYVDTTSAVFLGLTVGCARCHDHKFDPIPQRDFYRMQAIFAPGRQRPRLPRVQRQRASTTLPPTAASSSCGRSARRSAAFRSRIAKSCATKRSPSFRRMCRRSLKLKPEQAHAASSRRWPYNPKSKVKVSDDEVRAALSQADAERLHAIEKRLVSMFAGYGPPPMAPGVIDVGREAPRTYIALRGNPECAGREVGPGFLTVLGGGEVPDPPLARQDHRPAQGAGRVDGQRRTIRCSRA